MGRLQREHERVRRRRTAVLSSVVLATLAVGSTACGEENARDTRANGDTSTAPSTAPSTSTTTPKVPELKDSSTATVRAVSNGSETAQLLAVRVGSHEGYDRVVFELGGDLPGYDVGYLEGPAYEDGSGDEVDIDGEHLLSVRMTPASGLVIGIDEVEETYGGPDRIAGDGQPIAEVVRTGDFEAQSTWVIGVDGERPFKVSTLDSPTRVIVDVAES